MTHTDSDSAEVHLFGLPSLILTVAVTAGLVYIVIKLGEMVWPLAGWAGLVPLQ